MEAVDFAETVADPLEYGQGPFQMVLSFLEPSLDAAKDAQTRQRPSLPALVTKRLEQAQGLLELRLGVGQASLFQVGVAEAD